MKTVFDIVSHPDTIIILKNPLDTFAVWNQADVDFYEDVQEPDAMPEPSDATFVEEAAVEEPSVEEPAVEEPAVEEAAVEEAAVEEAAVEEAAVEEAAVEEAAVEEAAVEEPTVEELAAEPSVSETFVDEEAIHYHVSAQHLSLASTRFEGMLSGRNWKEGVPDKIDGLYHISAEDWDADALLILLNVVHHRNRQVPRSVSLEMLAKITVLIDYYDCAEAVELCTERWVDQLKRTSPVPSRFCRNLMLWMCIAWVLKLPHEFRKTTIIAINRKEQELSTLGLPIMGCIDKIEQVRVQGIDAIVAQLHDLLSEYGNPNYSCPSGNYSFECGSILFGALTREMQSAGLYNEI
ncbi:hypothetical protein GRF29_69g21024 [Pseudopithomyces chartarum]|uniref:BTB domain-containing protein n=1 Tax=Pseudopithomyces chartarum TaxID=1892770 RepID=A0AAN6LWT2_9PLEO|nr:hypothetical protein GRF29_69g21024 [Pseudopithomyces chartarum]